MKKNVTKLLCLLFVVVLVLSVVGCTKHVVIDGDYVIITVDADKVEQNSNLKAYMDYLVQEGQLEYEISDGMIVSIDGKTGGTNQYWMLYTSDTANANDTWGTCEYDGRTYGSATLGAEELVVKDGCVYIWYLQTF